MENESKTKKPSEARYSPEVRERVVRMVFEHEHEYERGALRWFTSSSACTLMRMPVGRNATREGKGNFR